MERALRLGERLVARRLHVSLPICGHWRCQPARLIWARVVEPTGRRARPSRARRRGASTARLPVADVLSRRGSVRGDPLYALRLVLSSFRSVLSVRRMSASLSISALGGGLDGTAASIAEAARRATSMSKKAELDQNRQRAEDEKA